MKLYYKKCVNIRNEVTDKIRKMGIKKIYPYEK